MTESGRREERAWEIIAEFLRARDAGQALDRREYFDRYPEHAAQFADFFNHYDDIAGHAVSISGGAARPAGKSMVEEAITLVSPPAQVGTSQGPIRVGDYELLEEIGRGGMGVIYRARQISLDRDVALKMILGGSLASAEDVRRFRSEAEAAARLDHPHIVPIHEVGAVGGQHYFAMKLIEGKSLAQALSDNREGKANYDRRWGVRVLAQVAHAVHHAHQHGILHRDLKPGNILLGVDTRRHPPDSGKTQTNADYCLLTTDYSPYVTDFGLAKRLEGASDLTRTGAIVGTPNYMAPEQAAGDKNLTPATDVFSLGAILFELLTGQKPFASASPQATLMMVREADPPRPRSIDPSTPRDLETICLKCLAKAPERRYQSAQALAEDLECWLAGKPIRARQASLIERAHEWMRRRRSAVVAAAVAIGCLCAVPVVVNSLQEERERRQREEKAKDQRLRLQDLAARRMSRQNEMLQYGRDLASVQAAIAAGSYLRAAEALDACPSNCRDWEWNYLRRLCRPKLAVESCSGFALSPDGKGLAVAGDSTLRLIDIETGKTRAQWKLGSPGPIAFSEDGRMLAEADKDIVLREVATGRVRGRIAVEGPLLSVVFVGKDRYLGTVHRNGTVALIDTNRGTVERQLPMAGARVVFHPDGQHVAAATADRSVKVVSIEGKEVFSCPGFVRGPVLGPSDIGKAFCCPFTPAFSLDGQFLVTSSGKDDVEVWDWRANKRGPTLRHGSPIVSAAFSRDRLRLATGAADGSIKIWDLASGKELRAVRGFSQYVDQVAFTEDGRYVAGCDRRRAGLWEVEPRADFFEWRRGRDGLFTKSSLSADGALLAQVGTSSIPSVHDTRTGKVRFQLNGQDGIRFVRFLPDAKHLATGGTDKTLRIWDAATGRLLQTIGLPFAPTDIVGSPDGAHVSAGDGTEILTWKLDGTCTGRHTLPSGRIHSLLYKPDGTLLAATADHRVVSIFEVNPCRLVEEVKNVTLAALAPDGASAVLNKGGTHVVRHFGSLLDPIPLRGINNGSIAFLPGSKRLFHGGADGRVRVFDLESGQELMALSVANEAVYWLAFSQDGRRLAVSLSYGDRIIVLNLP